MSFKTRVNSTNQEAFPEEQNISTKVERYAKQWAKRLECPVDVNANYKNTFVCPVSSRKGHFSSR